MTDPKSSLIEGICWFLAGLAVIGMIIKFSLEYRQ
jgi:hypothetical protein